MKTSLKLRIVQFLSTGFYSGYFPFAPGTAGSAIAVIFLGAIYFYFPVLISLEGRIAVAAVITLLAIISADIFWKEEFRNKGNDDPQIVVIDEFAGCAVTMIAGRLDLIGLLAAFFLFRIFDITKPPPARQAENLPGGYGIVLDDVFAGIYAAVCCWIFDSFIR